MIALRTIGERECSSGLASAEGSADDVAGIRRRGPRAGAATRRVAAVAAAGGGGGGWSADRRRRPRRPAAEAAAAAAAARAGSDAVRHERLHPRDPDAGGVDVAQRCR